MLVYQFFHSEIIYLTHTKTTRGQPCSTSSGVSDLLFDILACINYDYYRLSIYTCLTGTMPTTVRCSDKVEEGSSGLPNKK